MQENKFENRVQQQMDGFRIRPSDEVWQKVEEELRKKKKRRVIFYIVFLAGIGLLGYTGLFLFNTSKPNLVEQNTTLKNTEKSTPDSQTTPATETSPGNVKEQVKEDQLLPEKEEHIVSEEKTVFPKRNEVIPKEKDISTGQVTISKEKNQPVKKPIADRPGAKEKTYTGKPQKNIVIKDNDRQIAGKLVPQKEQDIAVIQKEDSIKTIIAKNEFAEDTQLPAGDKSLKEQKDSIPDEIVKSHPESSPVKKARKKKPQINWGIELSGGIASNREDAFSFGGEQKSILMDYAATPGVNIGATPAVVYKPSSIQSSPAFRVGLVGEMKISKRSTVSSGLQYAYYSNSIKVGAYQDPTVAFRNSYSQSLTLDAFYRGYHQKDYTNRFHFIQLPLQYHLQLNKGLKVPISWNIGGSLGYLVATNGLVYDTTASGIYYHDDDAFNKLNWRLNTGFSFRFGNRNKLQWSLGPELSLGINKMTKDDYTKKQYLLYGGITGRIIFTKKK